MGWKREEPPNYEEIVATKIPACQHCPMYDGNVRVPPQDMTKAPGVHGYHAPDVLVVGEAPGLGDRNRPFSGPAGVFIRDMLNAAGLMRRSYMTNIVRCRPFTLTAKGHRESKDPSKEIVRHCASQLIDEIYRIEPRVIITLGQAAFAWFVPKRSAKNSMGRSFSTRFGVPVVPITSPAAILRTGDRVDYERIKFVLANVWDIVAGVSVTKPLPQAILVEPPSAVAVTDDPASMLRLYKTQSEVPEDAHGIPTYWRETKTISWIEATRLIDQSTVVVGDIEATGLDPYAHDADVLSFAFAVRGPGLPGTKLGYVFPVWFPPFRGVMKRETIYAAFFHFIRLCVRKGLWFHNADYDMKYIAVMYKRLTGEEWIWERPPRCTLILHWMLEGLSSHDLEGLLASYGYVNHKRILSGHLRSKLAFLNRAKQQAKEAKDKERLHMVNARIDLFKRCTFAFAEWWLLSRYNAADSALGLYVLERLEADMQRHPLLRAFVNRQWDYLHTAHRMQIAGMQPNPPAIDAARRKQAKRIAREGRQLYYDPCFLQLLIEHYGYPVEHRVPFTPAAMEAYFKFTSGKNVSRLFFGRHTAKNENTGEQEIVESPSLDVSTSMSERNNNGYAVNSNLLKALKGADWDVVVAQHPWSEIDPDASTEETAVKMLGGVQIQRAYRRMLARGRSPAAALEKLRPLCRRSIAAHMIQFKNAKKYLSTYIDGMERRRCPDGLVRDAIKVHGTITGRWASFLHTVPRDDKSLKRQFCSRWGDDGIIISADQSQAEARVFASFSGDEKLLAIFRQGRDLHTEVAAAFHGIRIADVTEDQRNKGKTIHFATVYGMSVETLAVKLTQRGLQYDEALKYAERFVNWYFSNFKTLDKWIKRLMSELQTAHYTIASNDQARRWTSNFHPRDIQRCVVSPFGRELLIPMNCSQSDLRRYCANYPTQSAAGDITNIAAVRIDKALTAAGCDARLVLTVHDSVVIDAPKEELRPIAKIVAREMVRTDGYDWLKCGLGTDVIVGPNLGDLTPMNKWLEAHG